MKYQLLKDKVVQVWKVPSRSERGLKWHVREFEDGSMKCPCPSRRKQCPHIQTVLWKTTK